MKRKIKNCVFSCGKRSLVCKLMMVMLLLTHFAFSSENAFGQQNITVQFEQQSLSEVLRVLKQKTNYEFLYNDEEIKGITGITRSFTNASVQEVLTACLAGTKYSFKIVDNLIVITPDDKKDEIKKVTVKGKVVDERGEVLPGVTVLLKGTTVGVVTDIDGKFKIELPKRDTMILVFTFVGMKSHELNVGKVKDLSKEISIRMEPDTENLDEVVVTGYANVRKESFTGSSVTVKRDQLLKASATNVIQALQSFDPSFRIQRSNQWGSDPNMVPEIYIRGRSGIGVKALEQDALSKSALENNPNLPTFIMDGFEVSVQKVYDLDPNRVESITILKDAAATAMYGSRAANGVIVITTRAPKPGEVTISYNLTGTVTMPDLSDYNLSNAREKLDIEKRAGVYTTDYFATTFDAQREYNKRLTRVEEGVNTDWLSIPLRNAVNHKHSLSVEGGNADLRYNLELGYTGNNGVMKGSYRENVDLGFTVDWRLRDKLQVLNKITYTYTDATESPYGSFSDYAHLLPYDRPYNKDGVLVEKLDFSKDKSGSGYNLNNPLYEAKLNNYDFEKTDEFIDQFMFQWFLSDYFTFKGQLAVTKSITNGERFIDPNSSNATALNINSSKTNTSLLGDLYVNRSDMTKWDTQFSLYFTKTFGLHNLNASTTINAMSTKSESTSSHYRGFPSGEFHSPNYAAEIYRKPTKTESVRRLMGFLLSANYTWNDIYLADLSVRFDGSSEFGSDQKWAPFWSGGVGVNVHNYGFLKDNAWINQLKLRVSYGQTGKVNFPSYAAKTVFQTYDRWYATGFGVNLKALGNTDLKWETTNKLNVGTDLQFWNERISLNFDYYYNKTVDLITDVTLPSSSGFTSYKDNLGETLNEGFDIQVRFDVYQTKDWSVSLWGNLNHNTNKILKVSDALRAYNDQVNDYYADSNSSLWDEKYSKPIMKYEEGASLTSIFAVRSLGIDPVTGKELFLNRNGSISNTWSALQEVRVGDTEPKASGSFGVNLVYKNLSLFASFSYDWGKQTYNETLVNEVENANIQYSNVDRRVLTDRWQNPGDIAPLKDIKDFRTATKPTSRFVQDDNELSLSALTLSYDFNTEFVKKLYLQRLRLELSSNDLFRISTVRQERGTSYPFARSVNFSLRATF
ncbi:SusC/RagA family TonB-linked outer membrane protein [uncultured Butyricimonas sp.]|uniref:SusC/RagA family TonB-linked outer membrane protein n=1 Tax=uncultured Butyricimonas sp. TaxID=1268785 RepID=UPI0026DAF471|nr:SusC/RagA family TonB-linked outer membrane protein [uncultured Butyricimonas sp.]